MTQKTTIDRKQFMGKIVKYFVCVIFISAILGAEAAAPNKSAVAQKPSTLAVLNLVSKNITSEETNALSKRIRKSFKGVNGFKILDYGSMKKELLSQHFEQEGCFSPLCLWEIGKVLNVDRVVGGVVELADQGAYSISLTMVETKSGGTLYTETFSYEGERDTLSNKEMKHLVLKLLGEDTDNNLITTDTTSIPESVYELRTVVVTASRLPTTFNRLTRSVDIIGKDELERSPVITIDELLESVPGVNVMKRGPYGVQSDVSIRGATFEQTLVLIDGIKVTDPQTGHHSMNLPFSIKDVKKIEILKGAGSRMYGPNAFGGVINIITNVPMKRVTNIDISYGDYGFNEISLSTSLPVGSILNQNLSFNRKTSLGFRDDTDFEIMSLNYRSSMNTKMGLLKLTAGYIDKQFGAYSFYSTQFPNEWEQTTTTFANTQGNFNVGSAKLLVNTYWRRNKDDFILERDDPGFYRNIHTTDVFGLDMQSSIETSWGSFALGGEYNQDRIESTNLGDHARPRAGLFTEYSNRFFNRLDAVIGINGYYVGKIGWNILPGLDIGFTLTEGMRIYGTVNRSFRVPTFTELYYVSPFNMGNPELNVEEGTSYELGYRWLQPAFLTTISIFHRTGNNLIDWVRGDINDPWTARNIAAINTSGVEFSLKLSPQNFIEWLPIESARIGYTYLKMDREPDGFESKYVFNNFTHQTIMDIKHNLPYSFKQSWVLRYEAPVNDKARTLIDMRLERKISKVDVYISATNLLDVKYTDLTSVPMPGRWLRTGLSLSF